MKKKKLLALFAIMLIISIPIYSSMAFASFMQVTSYKGTDNIDGFINAPDDPVTVTVEAFVDDDPSVSIDQIRYGGSGSSPRNARFQGLGFDSCTFVDPHHECTVDLDSISFTSNPKTLKFYLYDDAELKVSSDNVQLYLDELDPVIESFTLSPNIVSSGDVTFSYTVKDLACNGAGCTDVCSGLDRVEITAASYTSSIPITQESCTNTNEVAVPLLTIKPEASGQITESVPVTLTVYDKLGKSATIVKTLNIDTTIPSISNLQITSNGNNLNHIAGAAIAAVVSVEVSGDNIDVNSVVADLTDLHTNPPASYENMQASCTPTATDTYICTFPTINVLLNGSKNVAIAITASDTAGNPAAVTLTKQINYDATGPVINSISTNFLSLSDISYMGSSNNKITIELTESGIGIGGKQIYLDLSDINPSLGTKQADSCTSSSCEFARISATREGYRSISITSNSADDLGNTVTGVLEKSILVDSTPPGSPAHSIENIGTSTYDDIIKTGDSLIIEINVTEQSLITNAYADLSSVLVGADNVIASSCINDSNRWTCTWTTTPIDVAGSIDSTLKFYLVDAANNTLPYNIPINVLGFDEQTTAPNYWTSRVECSPNRIDREMTPLIQARTFCHVFLEKENPSSDQEVLEVNLQNCLDNHESSSLGFIAGSELMNNEQGSTEPYIKLTLTQAEATLDKIDIKCPLQIISRKDTLISSTPEVEEVEIELEFYNNPLGEVSENLKEDIDDIVDDVDKGIFAIVGPLKQIVNYGETLCQLWSTLKSTVAGLHAIMFVIGGAEESLQWFPPGYSKANVARVGTCNVKESENTLQTLFMKGIMESTNSVTSLIAN